MKKGEKTDFMTLIQMQMLNGSQERSHQTTVTEDKLVEKTSDRKHLTEMIASAATEYFKSTNKKQN